MNIALSTFFALSAQCAPDFPPHVWAAIAETESGFNQFNIGVVNGDIRDPQSLSEAQKAVNWLESQRKNYSVGLVQINRINFKGHGLSLNNMFDPCDNLRAGNAILKRCFDRARKTGGATSYNQALNMAFSCYYSGNFSTGFKSDFLGQPPYVYKVSSRIAKYKRPLNPYPKPINLDQVKENLSHPELIAKVEKPTEQTNLPKPEPKLYQAWDVFKDF